MLSTKPSHMDPILWNMAIARLDGAHILQTWEWGKVKSEFGWQPHYLFWLNIQDKIVLCINQPLDEENKKHLVAGALVLQRKINMAGLSHRVNVLYVPKGPLLEWNDPLLRQRVLQDLEIFAQKLSAIFIKIDPDVEVGIGIPGMEESIETQSGISIKDELITNGWNPSDEQIQFRNTVYIDLLPSEEDLLTKMKQKTRYNVNLAIRKGVTIRTGKTTDLNLLYKMYAETSVRDGFTIRNESYYREVWNTFMQCEKPAHEQPDAEALIAEVDGIPVAAVIIFHFAGIAWYLYGMSTLAHRDKMANYLLQWEAIKRAKAANCTIYDFWGAPDKFSETDPLWGVYRFKEGFGGTVHRFIGAWDFPVNRVLYRLYSKTLPSLLDIMRKKGNARTKQVIG